MSDTKQRALLATAVRNAATTQCVFVPWEGLELAYRDGQLHKITPNTSQYERGYIPLNLRAEELPGMSDNAIWKRVMGTR